MCNIFHIYFLWGWPALCCFSYSSLYVPLPALVAVISRSKYLNGIQTALSSQIEAERSCCGKFSVPCVSLVSVSGWVHMWKHQTLEVTCLLVNAVWAAVPPAKQHQITSGLYSGLNAIQRHHLTCSYKHLPQGGDLVERGWRMRTAAGSSLVFSVSPTPKLTQGGICCIIHVYYMTMKD